MGLEVGRTHSGGPLQPRLRRGQGGAPGETRTHGLQVRNLTLYPLSYGRACWGLAEREGFEPSEQVTPLNGLANRRTRPLCDLSVGSVEIVARGPAPAAGALGRMTRPPVRSREDRSLTSKGGSATVPPR
jgi:hypothetical protein